MTLELEVGYDELDALGGPVEEHLAPDVAELFVELGLATSQPVRLLPVPLQIAQKLHACSAPGSERAHDLVDLQLLVPAADDAAVAEASRRLFAFRRAHAFPPAVAIGEGWGPLYDEAAEGLDVLPDVQDAVGWVNDYIARLDRIA
jgi:Nucleotidyl transferase AbiEii toxin, Type IV TA system